MSRLSVLFNQVPLLVNVELACILGLNESIVLQQVHYWVEKNKKEGRNFKDGYVWTYNTYNDWQEQFPFWSDSTIKRIFSKLEKMGLLVSAKYNKKSFDRTKWYRIDYEILNDLLNSRYSQNDTIGNSGDSSGELAMTQEEIFSEDTHYEARNVRAGRNDPMIDINLTQLTMPNCPDYECQNDPLREGNLTRPIPETNNRDYTEITTTTKISDSKQPGCCCEKAFAQISPGEIKQVKEIFNNSGIHISSNQVVSELAAAYTLNEIQIIATTLADRKHRGLITNPGGMLVTNSRAIASSILRGDFYPIQPRMRTQNNQVSSFSEYEIYVPPEYGR
ncbi:MAG TPA: hypothetical protein DD791_09790 [Syntrophomonas sp.]|jgi:hypothetical protein|nr:hypothetical protein [Syntrophomonas sp.]